MRGSRTPQGRRLLSATQPAGALRVENQAYRGVHGGTGRILSPIAPISESHRLLDDVKAFTYFGELMQIPLRKQRLNIDNM